MRPLVFSSLLIVFLSSCGDISDEELTKGEYFVSYYPDEGTERRAQALLDHMDSTKSGFKAAKLVELDSTLRVLVEGEFKNATGKQEQSLYAARLARELSHHVFGGTTCSVALVSSIDGDGSIHTPIGWSSDVRLDSLDRLMQF